MSIRELIIDWLTASRYVKWLEARHIEQRQDFTLRLDEKDHQIKLLRTELAAMRQYVPQFAANHTWQQNLPTPPPVVPAFSGPDDWQAELNRLYEKENDGISEQRREVVHEQTPDDGA